MVLSRQEKEKLVLDLYYNQGKNIHEISEEVRMSFRDIGAILDKTQKERNQKKSKHNRNVYHLKLTNSFQKVKLHYKWPLH